MKKSPFSKQLGFSLRELLVVIALIAIIAAVIGVGSQPVNSASAKASSVFSLDPKMIEA